MSERDIRLGVLGCGGFGLFALQQFAQVRGVRIAGMAGTAREAARVAAARFGVPDIVKVEDLVASKDVDLVYIATPPFLHHSQAMLALRAGKHVFCEKPLALNTAQADEMAETAKAKGLLLAANLMQRYNPLYERVAELVRSGALGEVIRGYFENYASDEGLAPDHWFWNREKSGGIFIEHGVHFFDMFEGLLGPGEVVSAQRILRPGSGIEEQVQCTVRYRDGILVNFYHGFCHPDRMDRQEMRIVFERGDITLFGWVPTRARIHAIADETNARRITEIFPGSRLNALQGYPARLKSVTARHKSFEVYQMFELNCGEGDDKLARYSELLRSIMADQAAWIRDSRHKRIIDVENGRRSLAIAAAADELARR